MYISTNSLILLSLSQLSLFSSPHSLTPQPPMSRPIYSPLSLALLTPLSQSALSPYSLTPLTELTHPYPTHSSKILFFLFNSLTLLTYPTYYLASFFYLAQLIPNPLSPSTLSLYPTPNYPSPLLAPLYYSNLSLHTLI